MNRLYKILYDYAIVLVRELFELIKLCWKILHCFYQFSKKFLRQIKLRIQDKLNDQGFLITGITYSSIIALVLSFYVFDLTSVSDRYYKNSIDRRFVQDRFISKHDDTKILQILFLIPPHITDLSILRQAYREYLLLSDRSFKNDEEFNAEVTSINSFEDYDKKASTSIDTFAESGRLSVKERYISSWLEYVTNKYAIWLLVAIQIINISFVTRLTKVGNNEVRRIKEGFLLNSTKEDQ
mgnify:CR=1 FL=1